MFGTHFLFLRYGDHRDLHVPTHSFPTRLTSDLDRARRGAETGIGAVGAAGPFPHAAEHLLQVRVAVLRRRLDRAGRIELLAAIPIEPRGRRLPFLFGWQARAGPARAGVGLEGAEFRHRRGGVAILPARHRAIFPTTENPPGGYE